jgi:hypothetical protein
VVDVYHSFTTCMSLKHRVESFIKVTICVWVHIIPLHSLQDIDFSVAWCEDLMCEHQV